MSKMAIAAGVALVALVGAASAQTVPAELAGTGRDVTFLRHTESKNTGCTTGVHRMTKSGVGANICLVSINQCLNQLHGTIARGYGGDWACKAPGR